MDKLLYINTVSDIRIREMANITGKSTKFPINDLLKIIIDYTDNTDWQNPIQKTIEITDLPYINTEPLGNNLELVNIELVFPGFSIIDDYMLVKQDGMYYYLYAGLTEEIVPYNGGAKINLDYHKVYWVVKLIKSSLFIGTSIPEDFGELTILYKLYIYLWQFSG